MLEHETECANGWVISRKLVVIKIMPLGCVLTADIDHGDGGIRKIFRGGLASNDGHAVNGGKEAAGEKFVLMGAAGMGEDEG
jgi:hypothetical protein